VIIHLKNAEKVRVLKEESPEKSSD